MGLKQLAKDALSTERLLALSKGHRYIFCYHHLADRIGGVDSPSYTTRTSSFKEHLAVLTRLFKFVSLDELVRPEALSSKSNYAAITFDDGFQSVFNTARPLLKAEGIPYAVFVNGAAVEHGQNWISNLAMTPDDQAYREQMLSATGVQDGAASNATDLIMDHGRFTVDFSSTYLRSTHVPNHFMGRKELAQLSAEGVLIGDHSWDHCVLGRCDEPMLELQVSKGRQLITDVTGRAPRHFAIPFGKKYHYGAATLAALARHGYDHIYSTNPNRVRKIDLADKDRTIPRIGLVDNSVKELLFYINRSLLRHYHL